MLCTKTGDQLVNPKTTLTWVLGAIGAPQFLLGLLVPMRESLSMLPQLVMAGVIRSLPYRKPAWLLGAFIQALAVCGMIVSAWVFGGVLGGWLLLVCLALFALARAVCSITGKDIMGKTIPKTQRGRINGWATTGSGLITIVLGIIGAGFLNHQATLIWLLIPMMLAVVLWCFAMFVYAGIQEIPGETDSRKSSGAQAMHAFQLVRKDKPFRHFLIARMFMTGSAMSAPYIVFISQKTSGLDLSQLGRFVAAGALASALSGWVWGRMADRSSRRVLICASGLAGLISLSVLLTPGEPPDNTFARMIYPISFLFLHIAHNGVRVGRKTYLLNMADGNKRTDYVAISNSLIGFFLIGLGVMVAFLSKFPATWFVFLFGTMSVCGSIWALGLSQLEQTENGAGRKNG